MTTEYRPASEVKCWHLVHGRPVGNTWIVYLTQPSPLEPNPDDHYGTWYEETTLAAVAASYAEHQAWWLQYAPGQASRGLAPLRLEVAPHASST